MKCLTLTQPMASLVVLGAKTIETRDWVTHYTGRIAIQAAKTFPRDAIERVMMHPYQETLKSALGVTGFVSASHLPRAAIIGTVELTKCFACDDETEAKIRARSARGALPPFEAEFGNYAAGRSGFVFANPRALPYPIPCKGKLGLWNMEPALEAAVLRALGEAV